MARESVVSTAASHRRLPQARPRRGRPCEPQARPRPRRGARAPPMSHAPWVCPGTGMSGRGQAARAAHLRVCLLGGFSVSVNGQPVDISGGSAKPRRWSSCSRSNRATACTVTRWWQSCGRTRPRTPPRTTCTRRFMHRARPLEPRGLCCATTSCIWARTTRSLSTSRSSSRLPSRLAPTETPRRCDERSSCGPAPAAGGPVRGVVGVAPRTARRDPRGPGRPASRAASRRRQASGRARPGCAGR